MKVTGINGYLLIKREPHKNTLGVEKVNKNIGTCCQIGTYVKEGTKVVINPNEIEFAEGYLLVKETDIKGIIEE